MVNQIDFLKAVIKCSRQAYEINKCEAKDKNSFMIGFFEGVAQGIEYERGKSDK